MNFNRFMLKISRLIAVVGFIITGSILFLRLFSVLQFKEGIEFNEINQNVLIVFIGLAALAFIFVILAFLNYLNSKGEAGYKIKFSEVQENPENKLLEYQSQLYTLGFRDFQVYEAVSPKNKELLFKVWLYLDETKTICAEMIEWANGNYALGFVTNYPDKFRLQTTFNKSMEYTSSLVFSRSFMKSLYAAFDYHARQQIHFAQEHGQPKQIDQFDGYLDNVDDRRDKQRALALYYLRWFLKGAFILLLLGFSQDLIVRLLASLFGGEATIFIILILLEAGLWFSKDLFERFNWSASNEEERQSRKATE